MPEPAASQLTHVALYNRFKQWRGLRFALFHGLFGIVINFCFCSLRLNELF